MKLRSHALLALVAFVASCGDDADPGPVSPRGIATEHSARSSAETAPSPSPFEASAERTSPAAAQKALAEGALAEDRAEVSGPGAPADDDAEDNAAEGTEEDTAANDTAAADPSQPAEAPRDLASELHAAAGDPRTCIDPSAIDALPASPFFDVEVTVSTSGVVTRSQVSSNGPSEEAIRCVKRRVEAHRFGPVEGAPKTIRTRIELRKSPP